MTSKTFRGWVFEDFEFCNFVYHILRFFDRVILKNAGKIGVIFYTGIRYLGAFNGCNNGVFWTDFNGNGMWLQENEGEGSMSWERYSHLYDLVQMGNKAFRENRLDEVIFIYLFLVFFA